jgi:predicted PurR-regulated permease PerM
MSEPAIGPSGGGVELNSAANTMIIGTLTVLCLYYLKAILLPLSVAIILYMLILPSEKFLAERLGNPILVYVAMAAIAFFGAYALSSLLYTEMSQFMDEELDQIELKLSEKTAYLSDLTIGGVAVGNATSLISEFITPERINAVAAWLASTITNILSNSLTVFILLVFLILEGDSFPDRLKAASPELFTKMEKIISNSSDAVNNYFITRFFISISQAIICALIMWAFGIPGVLIWAILYAILEWIPVIGATVATAFPALIGLLWLEPGTAILMTALLLGNCTLFASFIEPKIAGEKLGLSPMILILSLMGWGILWGPVGLIVGPVLTVVVRIILEENETTRPFGIMLAAQVSKESSGE